jgi:hypothetical protein
MLIRVCCLICLWIGGICFAEHFEFSGNFKGWKGDFADYPVGEEDFYELSWGWENLPVPHGTLSKGLYLKGNNHSDDLFMFVKYPIKGLKPDTVYLVHFDSVLIESKAPARSIGIGGAPGESVFFKVGASTEEPNKVNVNGYYLLNVDKGDQAGSGTDAVVIGDIAVPGEKYQMKKLTGDHLFAVRTDKNGKLWIFLGTDSGFEGVTKIYIARADVEVTEQ